MTEQEKKRQVAKISVFITSIFVIFLSISYAFINQTLQGTKRQVIISGNLELELKEGNAITLENALPMHDEVGMIQEPFEFKLINKTSNETNYTLKLTDITSNGTQKLDTNYVKYGLEKDGVGTKNLLSNLTDNIIDSGTLAGNGTINYNLRLWIDASVKDEELIKNKSLSYRIDVIAKQVKKVVYKGMIRASRLEFIDDYGHPRCAGSELDDYCEWTTSINSVILENQINIPEEIDEDKKWDLSVLNDGSVMGYLEEYGTSYFGVGYKLHIQGNGKIYANVNSKSMFGDFSFSEADEGINGLEYLDTSQVTDMSYMFSNYNSSQPLDLSKLNTSNVTNMTGMFSYYSSNQPLDLSGFDTSNVTNMSYMFFHYNSSQPLDLSNFNTSNVTDMSSMFSYYNSSQPLDLGNFNTSNVSNMSGMFSNYSGGTLTIGDWKTGKNANLSSMFSYYRSSQPLDLSGFDTSNVTNMSSMFYDYSSSALLGLSNFNTSQVTDMSSMFYNCKSLTKLDISGFDTSKVTNMSSMFQSCSSITELDVSGFDTSNVTNMLSMFQSCSSITKLDVSSFNTTKVTNMANMFENYHGSQSLDLSSFDTSNVTNMYGMFSYYSSDASLDISSFDFSKVTNKTRIFYRNSAYYASPILVKDEAMKTWVLKQEPKLTNVTIKS